MEGIQSAQTSATTCQAVVDGLSVPAVADVIGTSESTVRRYVRAGVVDPRRGPRGEYRFSFAQVAWLRSAHDLAVRTSAGRVGHAARRLRQRGVHGDALARQLIAMGSEILSQDDQGWWNPATGQGLLDFESPEGALPPAPVVPLNDRAEVVQLGTRLAGRARSPEATAEDWFRWAYELEDEAPDGAMEAYHNALELDPMHLDAHLNLGRLLHELEQGSCAEEHYRIVLTHRPDDSLAAFNLGVLLEDMDRPREAIGAYERAIQLEPDHADAHYNLARLYEAFGESSLALTHFMAYRDLSR